MNQLVTTPMLFGGKVDMLHPEWHMVHNGEPRSVRLPVRMTTVTNDSAVAAVVGGFGITRLTSYQVAEHLREGRHAPQ